MLRKKKQKLGAAIRRVMYRTLLVIIGLVIVGCCIFFWINRQQYIYKLKKNLAPQFVDISYDHIYSQTAQLELNSFVADQTKSENLLSFCGADFSKKLKNRFPFISKICVQRPTPEKLCINIVGAKPCLRLKDGRVLANRPEFFAQGLFADYGLSKIPQMELAQTFTEQRISQSLYSFFSKIPLAHWKKFNICYVSAEKIFVRPHEALLSYECIVDKDSFFDTKKLAQAEALFHQLQTSSPLAKKRKTSFIFDLRFADRIFVSQQKGGGGNEYRYAI